MKVIAVDSRRTVTVRVVEESGQGDVEKTLYTLDDINDEIDSACDSGSYSSTWIRMQCAFETLCDQVERHRPGIKRIVFTFADEPADVSTTQ